MDQDITTPQVGFGTPLLHLAGVPDGEGVDEGGGVEAEEGGDAGGEVAEGSVIGFALAADWVRKGCEVVGGGGGYWWGV